MKRYWLCAAICFVGIVMNLALQVAGVYCTWIACLIAFILGSGLGWAIAAINWRRKLKREI